MSTESRQRPGAMSKRQKMSVDCGCSRQPTTIPRYDADNRSQRYASVTDAEAAAGAVVLGAGTDDRCPRSAGFDATGNGNDDAASGGGGGGAGGRRECAFIKSFSMTDCCRCADALSKIANGQLSTFADRRDVIIGQSDGDKMAAKSGIDAAAAYVAKVGVRLPETDGRLRHRGRCNCGLTVYRTNGDRHLNGRQKVFWSTRALQDVGSTQSTGTATKLLQCRSAASLISYDHHSATDSSSWSARLQLASCAAAAAASGWRPHQPEPAADGPRRPNNSAASVSLASAAVAPTDHDRHSSDGVGDVIAGVAMETLATDISRLDVNGRTEPIRERETMPLATAIKKFNINASEGIEYLQDHCLVGSTAYDVAKFLYLTNGLSKRAVGEYLGERGDFNVQVLKEFVNLHDFKDVNIVPALRQFLSNFRLPGESQKIERVMEHFARRYCHSNPAVFANADACHVLSYSIIMLNTSLHNPRVKDRMSAESFVSVNRSQAPGEQTPTSEFLNDIYSRVKNEPFRVPEDIDDCAFFNPIKDGWLCKRGGRYKSWKRRWFILKDNCLYYFLSEKDKLPIGIIPLENLLIRDVADRNKSYCFELYASGPELIKACKTGSDGQVVRGNHRVFRMSASSVDEQKQWMEIIRRSTRMTSSA